jgi:hypothetical protein
MSDVVLAVLAAAGFFAVLSAIGWSMWMTADWWMNRGTCEDCGVQRDHAFNCQMNWHDVEVR